MRVLTKFLLCAGALALTSAPLPASANPCGNTTYNNWLVSGFPCTIGDQTYSDFSFGSATVTANQISVGPDPSAPAHSFGLVFSSSALSVLGAGTVDVTLDYTVTSPTVNLDDAFLTIAGVVTGNGSATVGETVTTPAGPFTLQVGLPSPATDHITFPPTAGLSVLKDALVISLTGNDQYLCDRERHL